jgi:hypothetical protein
VAVAVTGEVNRQAARLDQLGGLVPFKASAVQLKQPLARILRLVNADTLAALGI